jgi:hypothetical protein
MAEKKIRIAGPSYHKMQDMQKELEDKSAEFDKWQNEQFKEGSPLRDYYRDQVNFITGAVFKYGGVKGAVPIDRIKDKKLIDKANEYDTLVKGIYNEMTQYARLISKKLSIKLNKTVYASQIDFKTGEVHDLPDEVETVNIDVEESDEETVRKMEEEQKAKDDKVVQL